MVIYNVKTPDGSMIKIQGPDNATDAQLAQAVTAYANSVSTPSPTPAPERGFLGSIKEAVTGAERATPETQSLPDWATMPELNQLSLASAKTGLGTLLSNPAETAQIIKANFPDTEITQDAKGNYLLKSSIDGKQYAIPPGFKTSDIPRAAGALAAFTPAGKAATIPGMMLGAGATQAAIETSQAATGGEFNPGEVGAAALLAGAVPVVGQAAAALKTPAKALLDKALGKVIPSAEEVQTPLRAAQESAVATPEAPVVQTPTTVVQAPAALPEAQLSDLIKKATSTSSSSVKAREQLASMAKVNPEAKAAADRLGLDLPADVFSDNPQIRSAIGLTRSVAGSEAEAGWRNTVSKAVDKADDAIKTFDAQFVEGSPSLGSVSQTVRDTLAKTRADLSEKAGKIYTQVDDAIPKQTNVELPTLTGVLNTIKSEVGAGGLSSAERKLSAMIDSSETTYGRLLREKSLIGKAIAGQDSPYGNMEAGALKRLYGALSEDQLGNVQRIGGDDLGQQLRGANLIYAQERALGDRIVNAFGEDADGSIANLMRNAITSASKGDSAQFTKLMKVVPDDLKKPVVATALASITRSARGAERGGFGFDEFAKTYRGLRANPSVYAEIVKHLGPTSNAVLRDLYEVSKRITDARAQVLNTGKANQGLLQELRAENLVSKILQSTAAKGIVTGASAVGGGPAGAIAASVLTHALSKGGKDAVSEAGKLFASPEFQKLAIQAATKPQVDQALIKKVAMSQQFKKYADAIKLNREPSVRERWLIGAIESSNQGKTP